MSVVVIQRLACGAREVEEGSATDEITETVEICSIVAINLSFISDDSFNVQERGITKS
jgi:hypothetical protein